MIQKQEKNWWQRNWKWLVPVWCFTIFALFTGFVVLIIYLVFSLGKSSDAYKEALTRAQSYPAVLEFLGTPIEEGWYITGSINISGPSGEADIAFPISGPKGKATVYVVASKSAGLWSFSTLAVKIKSTGLRIDLLGEKL